MSYQLSAVSFLRFLAPPATKNGGQARNDMIIRNRVGAVTDPTVFCLLYSIFFILSSGFRLLDSIFCILYSVLSHLINHRHDLVGPEPFQVDRARSA